MHKSARMNSDSSEILFTGGEGLSCHQFIRAIRERALEAEKQRDNQWIADYASIRFDGEALKWFESLEDDVQSDWQLLRRAIISRYSEPTYEESTPNQPASGLKASISTLASKDKDECRKFVRSIRMRAQIEGKINDPRWMCETAYAYFDGDALEWHASLPVDVKNDWHRLERALLIDFPRQVSTSLTPARVHIDNWWSSIYASVEMRSLRSREQWLERARERRRLYFETGDKSMPCWLLADNQEEIPDNAIETGGGPTEDARYSARAWHEDEGLIVGQVGRSWKGAQLPWDGKRIFKAPPFEVLIGNPAQFHWVTIPDCQPASRKVPGHKPFNAVEAGFETKRNGQATLVGQIWYDNLWRAGKTHTNGWTYISYDQQEVSQRP
ncbi:hypothetical protein FRB90_007652, partial [Tulasnella sp. 427]